MNMATSCGMAGGATGFGAASAETAVKNTKSGVMVRRMVPHDMPMHRFLFARGAGGGRSSPFMPAVAGGLEGRGIAVVRFEFPYMQAGRRVPDRESVLLQ